MYAHKKRKPRGRPTHSAARQIDHTKIVPADTGLQGPRSRPKTMPITYILYIAMYLINVLFPRNSNLKVQIQNVFNLYK